MVCREDLRQILKEVQGQGKNEEQATIEVETVLDVLWDRYLASSFERAHVIQNEEGTSEV